MATASWAQPPYEPNAAARGFSVLGAEACTGDVHRCLPPDPGTPMASSDWVVWAMNASFAPPALVTLGTGVALFVALRLCRPGGIKTPSRPILAMSCAVLLLVWIGAGWAVHTSLDTYNDSSRHFSIAAKQFRVAQADLDHASNMTTEVVRAVDTLMESCHGLRELVRRSLGQQDVDKISRLQVEAKEDLKDYMELITLAYTGLASFPPVLNRFETRMRAWPEFLSLCFVIPAKLTALCVITVVAVGVARSLGRSSGGCLDSFLAKAGAGIFALLVLIVVVASAGLLGLGVSSGSYCMDPNGALLGFATGGRPSPDMLSASRYYFMGRGHSTSITDLEQARQKAQHIKSMVEANKRPLDMLRLVCDAVEEMKLQQAVVDLNEKTDQMIQLAGGESIYGHYSEAVHKGICGKGLSALGWLSFFQVLISVVLLPVVIILVHDFLREDDVLGNGGNQVLPQAWGQPGPGGSHRLLDDGGRNQESSLLLGRAGNSFATANAFASGNAMSSTNKPIIGSPQRGPQASNPMGSSMFGSMFGSQASGVQREVGPRGMSPGMSMSPPGAHGHPMHSSPRGSHPMHSSPIVVHGPQNPMHSAPAALGPGPNAALRSFVPVKAADRTNSLQSTPQRSGGGGKRVHFAQ